MSACIIVNEHPHQYGEQSIRSMSVMQPSYFNQAISQPAKLLHALRVEEVHINSSPVSDPCFSAFIIQYGENHSTHKQSCTHTRQKAILVKTSHGSTGFLYSYIMISYTTIHICRIRFWSWFTSSWFNYYFDSIWINYNSFGTFLATTSTTCPELCS